MFRTAVLRSAAAATRAIRPAVQQSAPLARRSLVAPQAAFRAAPKAISVRMYSAAAGLNKQEVEGRIFALLQGFDKVNDPANVRHLLLALCPLPFALAIPQILPAFTIHSHQFSCASVATKNSKTDPRLFATVDQVQRPLRQRPWPGQLGHRRGCHGH